ncbi:hypothetical protein KBI52_29685 [Microvirga sp. HBU67558]|uniref:hypothetical protein n=1 Tax=Microvirga TaxID=186650 RepID=UPI001B35C706|nr:MULTISPECIES: hypothetical protein [unclassified Microvirga]MBQ0824371.1 hypothetical protein [Microvirga sp. HBU67558]
MIAWSARRKIAAKIIREHETRLKALGLTEWRLRHVRNVISYGSRFSAFERNPVMVLALRVLWTFTVIRARMYSVSPYDDPILSYFLNDIAKRVEKILSQKRIALPVRVLIANWPIGSFEGYALKASEGFRAITIYDGIFTFSHILTKILLTRLHIGIGELKIVQDPAKYNSEFPFDHKDQRYSERLSDLLIATLVRGDPHEAVYFDSPHTRERVESLVNAMQIFVVSHEYGHCVLHSGHITTTKQQQELEADRFALDMTLSITAKPQFGVAYRDPITPADAVVGIDLFFLAAQICFEAAAVFDKRWLYAARATSTHPSLLTRRAAILSDFGRMHSESDLNVAMRESEILRRIAHRLLIGARRSLEHCRDKDMTLHPVWMNRAPANWPKSERPK